MNASRRKKGKEDPDISSSSDFWTTRQLKDYLTKQEAAISGRKSIGLVSRQGQGIDALDNVRSVDTDRHSMTGENILFFFCHFFTKLFFYSYFFLRVMFLFGETQRALLQSLLRGTQLCRFPFSLAWLNFLASRSLDPQINTLPKETFALP